MVWKYRTLHNYPFLLLYCIAFCLFKGNLQLQCHHIILLLWSWLKFYSRARDVVVPPLYTTHVQKTNVEAIRMNFFKKRKKGGIPHNIPWQCTAMKIEDYRMPVIFEWEKFRAFHEFLQLHGNINSQKLYCSICHVACSCFRNQPLQWSTQIFSAKCTRTANRKIFAPRK